MKTKIALIGAGGKMGCRIADNLMKCEEYEVDYVEVSSLGVANLASRRLQPTAMDKALVRAEAVILAIPDKLIKKITEENVPKMKPGTLVIGLDPAAAYAGVMPVRDDLAYFVAHPCHPPLFNDEVTAEARADWFGGVHAKHHIVCALYAGPEESYALGERIARAMYAPVMKSFRVTVEQMAILEPALSETLSGALIAALKEGYDEAVKMGVPAEAAWEFLSGHIRIEVGIIFGFSGFPMSEGAKLAIANAKEKLFKPDWKEQVMNLEALKRSVRDITEQA